MNKSCKHCYHIHAGDDARAIGRFAPGGPIGYKAKYEGNRGPLSPAPRDGGPGPLRKAAPARDVLCKPDALPSGPEGDRLSGGLRLHGGVPLPDRGGAGEGPEVHRSNGRRVEGAVEISPAEHARIAAAPQDAVIHAEANDVILVHMEE